MSGRFTGSDKALRKKAVFRQKIAALTRPEPSHKDGHHAYFGAIQHRLENTAAHLQIQAENLQTAESRISDTDMATEMTEFVRSQVLTYASTAMLAQVTNLPKTLLELLR